jgi:hypothetical protein
MFYVTAIHASTKANDEAHGSVKAECAAHKKLKNKEPLKST